MNWLSVIWLLVGAWITLFIAFAFVIARAAHKDKHG